jgi:hypothetical protein
VVTIETLGKFTESVGDSSSIGASLSDLSKVLQISKFQEGRFSSFFFLKEKINIFLYVWQISLCESIQSSFYSHSFP